MFLAMISFVGATMVAAALDPAGLARLSDGWAEGAVTETSTQWSEGSIWTIARLEDEHGRATELWLRGGCIDGVCLTVAGVPTVEQGDRLYVFLRGREPTSLSQGLFYVEGDTALRDTTALAVAQGPKPTARYALSDLRRAGAKLPQR